MSEVSLQYARKREKKMVIIVDFFPFSGLRRSLVYPDLGQAPYTPTVITK